MKRIIAILVFLVSNYCAISTMEKPQPWYARIFSWKKELTPIKNLTQEQKDQEFAKLLNNSCNPEDILRFKELIAMGVNVNVAGRDGDTLLMKAAYSDKYELVHLLLQVGADPNIQNLSTSKRDEAKKVAAEKSFFGSTRLLYAALALTEELQQSWDTALLKAAFHGRYNCVQLLLDGGADRTMQNPYGQTALDLAQEKGFTDVADLLSKMKKLR